MTELVLSLGRIVFKGVRQQIVVVQNIYKLKVHPWDA